MIPSHEPQEAPQLPPILTIAEAAAYLRCHRVTLYKEIHSGRLAVLKIGGAFRVSRAALEAWIKGQGKADPST